MKIFIKNLKLTQFKKMQTNTTCSANGQRQTAIRNDEVSTMWETKPRTTRLKTCRLLMGPALFTRPKILQTIWWWWWWWWRFFFECICHGFQH